MRQKTGPQTSAAEKTIKCRFALNPKNPSQQFQKDSLALNLRIGT
ncbi:hypothetical protein J2X08_004494 [Rhizobium rosettiformans]|nr:hypothetical protein [Rhizobium rosettiformans]MDR7066968.1 hypothetical protein [Rhizobium rosettiformans]